MDNPKKLIPVLRQYHDIDHFVIYFLVWDHPGFWPVFLVAFVMHVSYGLARHAAAEAGSAAAVAYPLAMEAVENGETREQIT